MWEMCETKHFTSFPLSCGSGNSNCLTESRSHLERQRNIMTATVAAHHHLPLPHRRSFALTTFRTDNDAEYAGCSSTTHCTTPRIDTNRTYTSDGTHHPPQ